MLVCVIGEDLPLGQAISQQLQSDGVTVIGVSNALYLAGGDAFHQYLSVQNQADFIIHAAEMSWWQAEEEPDLAEMVNLRACSVVVEFAGLWKAAVIFLSSFMVFDGTKKNPYISANSGQPLNVHGHTKVAAENYFLEKHPKTIVIRLGWLLDACSDSWLGHLIDRLLKGEVLEGYKNVNLSPTAVEDVARVIAAVLKQLECKIEVWGLYHYGGTEPVSHEKLVRAIQYQVIGQEAPEVQIVAVNFIAEESSVELPKNGVLGCIKLRNTFGIKQLPWKRYLPSLVERRLAKRNKREAE